jgi:hypothetical protein
MIPIMIPEMQDGNIYGYVFQPFSWYINLIVFGLYTSFYFWKMPCYCNNFSSLKI